tara:strand:- start:649 stop:918 length:270 start_codon:yes stop_codon:yes gene_type:complete
MGEINMDFYIKHYNQLKGWTIEGCVKQEADEYQEEYYELVLRKGKAVRLVQILCDEEGNGAGFLSIDKTQSFTSAVEAKQVIKNTFPKL